MKKPPSRIRYEKSHPVVSARLNMHDYEKLKKILKTEGKSFAQFIKEKVNESEIELSKAYDLGYVEGTSDWQIFYLCSICDKAIDVKPLSESHFAITDYMKEHGWAHSSCHRKNS